MKLEDFIKEAHIDLSLTKATRIDFRMDSSAGWSRDSRHWQVTLFRHDGGDTPEFRTEFTQGSAYKKPPTGLEVLQSLLMDVQGFEGQTFEEWAGNLGLNTDSRNDEKIYLAVARENLALQAWLGHTLYNKFINCECDF